jgi:hypothetical protein
MQAAIDPRRVYTQAASAHTPAVAPNSRSASPSETGETRERGAITTQHAVKGKRFNANLLLLQLELLLFFARFFQRRRRLCNGNQDAWKSQS